MMLLWLIIGLIPPAALGYTLVNALESRTKILFKIERICLGFLFGVTFSQFIVFTAHRFLNVPLTFAGIGSVNGILLVLAALLFWFRPRSPEPAVTEIAGGFSKPWMRLLLWVLVAMTALKVIVGTVVAMNIPSGYDDTMDNWNFRAKVFLSLQRIELALPPETTPSGVSSYPPTIPLLKTWLMTLNGSWNEGLANAIHPLFYLAMLGLVWSALRRVLHKDWVLLGLYVAASLPLAFIQGMNAYADTYLSAHYAAAVFLLWQSLGSQTADQRGSALKLAALATALMPFTKNEAFVLYLPSLGLFWAGTLMWLWRTKPDERSTLMKSATFLVLGLAVICAVWIGFKLQHGLPFGNAKSVNFDLVWQPGVVTAVLVNSILEGNWLMLFPVAFVLLLWRWKDALGEYLILTAAVLIPYGTQMFAFLFTALSTEALGQTGYARGIIHLVPVLVVLTVLLLEKAAKPRIVDRAHG